jgi:hypothetical protein
MHKAYIKCKHRLREDIRELPRHLGIERPNPGKKENAYIHH